MYLIISTHQMRKSRHRGVKWFACSYTSIKWCCQNSVSLLSGSAPCYLQQSIHCVPGLHIFYFFNSLQSYEVGDKISIWQMKKLRLTEKKWQCQSVFKRRRTWPQSQWSSPLCDLSKELALVVFGEHGHRHNSVPSATCSFCLLEHTTK